MSDDLCNECGYPPGSCEAGDGTDCPSVFEESTPLFDEVLDELGGYPADVDTEYQVLVAQAVLQLLAPQASP